MDMDHDEETVSDQDTSDFMVGDRVRANAHYTDHEGMTGTVFYVEHDGKVRIAPDNPFRVYIPRLRATLPQKYDLLRKGDPDFWTTGQKVVVRGMPFARSIAIKDFVYGRNKELQEITIEYTTTENKKSTANVSCEDICLHKKIQDAQLLAKIQKYAKYYFDLENCQVNKHKVHAENKEAPKDFMSKQITGKKRKRNETQLTESSSISSATPNALASASAPASANPITSPAPSLTSLNSTNPIEGIYSNNPIMVSSSQSSNTDSTASNPKKKQKKSSHSPPSTDNKITLAIKRLRDHVYLQLKKEIHAQVQTQVQEEIKKIQQELKKHTTAINKIQALER